MERRGDKFTAETPATHFQWRVFREEYDRTPCCTAGRGGWQIVSRVRCV